MLLKVMESVNYTMFSVIIPAYNAEKFIATAIQSVLQQTNPNFEIIVVDDGSADNTNLVVDQIADARIKYIHQENSGVSVARNTGIQNASGAYICFLDADDEWDPDHLHVLDHLIQCYSKCTVYCTGHRIRLTTGKLIPRTEQLLKAVRKENFSSENGYDLICRYGYLIHTNSVCFRKEAIHKVGYFEPGIKNGEDDDMWYRLLAYYSVAVSKKMTTTYNRANSSATAKTNIATDWIFLKRVDAIMASPDVTPERKLSLAKLLEQKKLTDIRQDILAGYKKGTVQKLLKLNWSILPRKKHLETWVALLIPHQLLQKRIHIRDRGFFH